MMHILHVHNMAGVASNLSFFQRKLGLECKVIAKGTNPFGFGEEHYQMWENLFPLRFFLTYDIIHYHSNTWFRRGKFKHFDYQLCKRLGKKIVLHFHGSDLRVASQHLELKEMIEELKVVLISTPDLLTYLPHEKSTWLPSPINPDMWHLKPMTHTENKFRIGYYNPPLDAYTEEIYGTTFIEAAITNLKRKGFDLEGKPVYGKPYRDMPSYYSSIDVFVGRLGMGWYGISACEAMVSGVPVITNIRNDLRYLLPSKEPFLVSSKKNIEKNLEMALSDESLRKQLIQRGKKYVLDVHDGLKVAKSLVKTYRGI